MDTLYHTRVTIVVRMEGIMGTTPVDMLKQKSRLMAYLAFGHDDCIQVRLGDGCCSLLPVCIVEYLRIMLAIV